ncbi:MAG: Type 1 glutamine amidotransferase-like domain-containing protein [Dehalococcoidales bacterium]|nr:Type 1 glutamine amidotransferase-like domain-containing protein [Dehalococcoidales bacterium]
MNQKPVFLFAGGRRDRKQGPNPDIQTVYRTFGIKSPTVAYIGVASGDDRNFFGWIASELTASGADKVVHAVTVPKNADLNKARKILEDADIVYMSGGDVDAGMAILQEKHLVDFFTGLYRQGKPFFGMSAGALMLCKKWVLWDDTDNDDSARLFDCLNFAPVICDAHDEDSDWEELKAALKLEKEGVKGYGLGAGSSIKVTPAGEVSLVGGNVYQYVRRGNEVVALKDALPPCE